ncbi:MAG: hypothetical protein PHY28_04325 [Dehalococcoidales bacterium]|nr:hypothetical protein [Dehalococcoidales bacterium]
MYGYVNPGGELAVKNELSHRLGAYLEAKKMMKACKNMSLFIALKHFSDEISMK